MHLYLRYIQMIQRRKNFRFALKPSQSFRVLCQRGRKSFDRYFRSGFVSLARYTSPIPPAPISARISYGPSLSPGESGIRLNQFSLADQKVDRECITA